MYPALLFTGVILFWAAIILVVIAMIREEPPK